MIFMKSKKSGGNGKMKELIKIQTELKAPKNLFNSFGKYKYRNFEGICEAVKPLLAETGCTLIVSDDIVWMGDRYYVKAVATLTNSEGESEYAIAYAREASEKKGMDDAQITGTASSYARKYACNGLFLLDDTKDADTDEYHEETELKKVKEQATNKINKEQVESLSRLLKDKNISLEYIKEMYYVKSLEDMTQHKYMNLLDHIDTAKERYEKWKVKQG